MFSVTNFNIVFIESSTTGAGALCNKEAQNYGAKVYLLSDRSRYNYDSEITNHVDELIDCQTNDFQNVIETLLKLKERIHIHAVTTTADLYVPQASVAAKALNLIGLSPSAAQRARNKLLMRQALSKFYPAYNPQYFDAYTKEDAFRFVAMVGFPIIAKPKNGDGSDKVQLLFNESDIENYFIDRVSWGLNNGGQFYEPGVLLEGFIDGMEFSVETTQNKGQDCQLIGVTSKEISKISNKHFIEIGHYFPYLGPEVSCLETGVKNALKALDIDCGLIHTECKIDNNGKFKIIEINPRLAGGKIGSHLIELATGFNPPRAIIDIAIGRPVCFKPIYNKGAAIHYLLPTEEGVFEGLANVDELKRENSDIKEIYSLLKPGQRFKSTGSNYDRIACIIATGTNGLEAFKRAKRLSSLIQLNKLNLTNE